MKKPDWIIHLVCIESPAGFIDAHTHGMREKYNHLEFQMVLPVSPETIGKILNLLGDRVRNGDCFHDGEMVSDILVGYDVKLRKMVENGEELLRVMLPDEKGRFPGDVGCEPMFSVQDRPLAELKRYFVPKSGIDYAGNIKS